MNAFGAIEKLRADHVLEGFDCGKPELNQFLLRHALPNQRADGALTYVLAKDRKVLGYYSLAAGAASYDQAPGRVRKGLARHPVPVIVLARLAVDRALHGRSLGPALLKDALLRSASAAGTIGARALLVHAKDIEARRFYLHFGFEPSYTDPLHLFLIMKDIRRRIGD